MSAFTINTITIQGINIIAKLIAGSTLEFTKIELGDGQLQGVNPQSVTALTNTVVTLPITAVSAADGTATVTGVFTNKDITTGFFYRELGLFAKDPETGEEKLYCYGNAENNAEWIPPSGSETVVEKKIKINTICGNATKVTATLASGIYVTKETVEQEIEIHNKDMGAHEVLFATVALYVATNGNDNNPGTEDKPLKTIQAAVEKVPVASKSSVIHVAAGTYNEDVTIWGGSFKYLEIVSTTPNGATVNSIAINSGNLEIRIKDFNIKSEKYYGITAIGGRLHISGCKFTVGSKPAENNTAVRCSYAAGYVGNCTITGYTYGIYPAYGSSLNVVDTTLTGNTKDMYVDSSIVMGDSTITNCYTVHGGAIIDAKMGNSLTAGVADSTTDKADSSKKLVSTEFLTNQIVAQSLGTNGYIKYADGRLVQWGTVMLTTQRQAFGYIVIPKTEQLLLCSSRDGGIYQNYRYGIDIFNGAGFVITTSYTGIASNNIPFFWKMEGTWK